MTEGVVGARRERRAREKPRNAAECDLTFYKQRAVLHAIDRCMRWAAGQQVADGTMHPRFDAYHHCRMHGNPATVHSGEKMP
eukprot:4335906-Pyramimonas_sp.AAC.1